MVRENLKFPGNCSLTLFKFFHYFSYKTTYNLQFQTIKVDIEAWEAKIK